MPVREVFPVGSKSHDGIDSAQGGVAVPVQERDGKTQVVPVEGRRRHVAGAARSEAGHYGCVIGRFGVCGVGSLMLPASSAFANGKSPPSLMISCVIAS